jgi:hypothetical protein
VPIEARPIHAILEFKRSTGISLPLIGPQDFLPDEGDYNRVNLAVRVERWMEARYGSRLKIDMTYGRTAILIRDDPWLVTVPLIYGQVSMLADRDLSKKYDSFVAYTKGEPEKTAKLNVLGLIKDLPQSMASSLFRSELRAIVREVMCSHDLCRDLSSYHSGSSLAKTAMSDLTSGAKRALDKRDEFGLSRWDSLQAAEKLLKLYLEDRVGNYPKGRDGHMLNVLFEKAEAAGLEPPPSGLIDTIQCSPSVRYEATTFSVREVVAAHRAATAVGYAIMQTMHPRE